eukprot:scaffold21418_cov27-Tisochrysis_lutea.AAC.2
MIVHLSRTLETDEKGTKDEGGKEGEGSERRELRAIVGGESCTPHRAPLLSHGRWEDARLGWLDPPKGGLIPDGRPPLTRHVPPGTLEAVTPLVATQLPMPDDRDRGVPESLG